MANKSLPSPEVLRQLLRYEPETGKLFWRERGLEWFSDSHRKAAGNAANWNARYAGREAFTADNGCGYRVGAIQDRLHLAHRVIWAMQTGEWPETEVDHEDVDGLNNRWANLRLASRPQNQFNTKPHADSKSGVKGLWQRPDGKWRVRIRAESVSREVGIFGCKTAAAAAYAKASAELHGEFGRVS